MSWKILTPLLSISFLICACGGGSVGDSSPESAEKVANEISDPEPPAEPVIAVPVTSPALSAVPVTSPALSAVPVTSPALSAVPAGSPALSAVPDGSPALSAVPVTSPALSAVPAGSPALSAVPAPAIPAPAEKPVIEKSSIKATIYSNGLVDVKKSSASALSTWKCGGGKKGNLAGYEEGESEEVSNQRYAKRFCGIEYSRGVIPIFFRNADQNLDMFMHVPYKETKIKILPSTFKSNLESVKVTIREDLNRLSRPIVPENNDPWPHIQIRLNDHLNEDIQIKGTFLDPEGKEGEFNATIKVHSISEEVYERWRKPEVSPVRVEFAEENFIFGIFGRDEKELYVWKCPLDFDGNLDGLAKSWPTEEEKNAAFDKATLKKGCGLIRHNKESSFIPLNWMGNEVITKRRFERPSPIAYEKAYQEFEKLYNAYGIQLPDDLRGFDNKRTAGVLVRKFPRDIAVDRGVRIPIQIVDDQDRASISYLNLRFLLITDTLLEKWSYKGD